MPELISPATLLATLHVLNSIVQSGVVYLAETSSNGKLLRKVEADNEMTVGS